MMLNKANRIFHPNNQLEILNKVNERDFQLYLILSAIAKGARTINELTQECHGLYPLELRELINELIQKGRVRLSSDGFYFIEPEDKKPKARQPVSIRHNPVLQLPEPHPHDYDWRFDAFSSKKLAKMLNKETPIDGSVLLLGTPSVFIEMADSQNPPPTTLLDWNLELLNCLACSQLPQSFTLVHHDLFSDSLWEPNHAIDVVLSDPPWYPEHYAAFLIQAACVTRIGGTIIFVLLPINTRPNAVTDRWKILDTAHRIGFHIQTLKPNAIKYTTPIFESTSLDKTKIKVSNNWRSGDIVIFKKICEPSQKIVQELLSSIETDDQEWAEALIGRYKVKLRGPFSDYSAMPQLIAIEKNNVLPTVSRRYDGRKFIDLWLWDNRVFAVKGKAAFLAALYTLSGRTVPHYLRPVTKEKHNYALSLLQRLIKTYNYSEQKIA